MCRTASASPPKLNKLATGAVVAATGGSIVLGIVFGGIFWMPACAAGALLAYRAGRAVLDRLDGRQRRQMERWDSVYLRIAAVESADDIPQDRKEALLRPLNAELDALRAEMLPDGKSKKIAMIAPEMRPALRPVESEPSSSETDQRPEHTDVKSR